MLDQRVAGRAAGGVEGRVRMADHHRYLDRYLVEQVLLPQPVVAQIVAVVGCHHQHGVLGLPGGVEVVEQHTQLIVALLDQAHVGDDRLVARAVITEGRRDGVGEESLIHRVGVLPLPRFADQRLDVIFGVHVVVGRGHDVGPVRLDVGQVRAPRPLGPVKKVDGLAGQPRGFAVGLGDVGGLVRVLDEPA